MRIFTLNTRNVGITEMCFKNCFLAGCLGVLLHIVDLSGVTMGN